MQRLVLDRDLNEQIEENIREAWEVRQKNEGKESDEETKGDRVQERADPG